MFPIIFDSYCCIFRNTSSLFSGSFCGKQVTVVQTVHSWIYTVLYLSHLMFYFILFIYLFFKFNFFFDSNISSLMSKKNCRICFQWLLQVIGKQFFYILGYSRWLTLQISCSGKLRWYLVEILQLVAKHVSMFYGRW